MKKQLLHIVLCLCFISTSMAQQTPAPKQTTTYSIVGATAHIGNGKLIENSLIIFTDGKVSFVGESNSSTQSQGTIINATGKHVYPGFIAANTTLGLGEIDAVKASMDTDEIGGILPHIRSIIAYNAESKIVESMRPNGVLMGQITPRGGTISGSSSIVQFDAWNWEDAAIKLDQGIHLNWPSSVSYAKWWLGEEPGSHPNKKYTENINKINDYFTKTKNYQAGNQHPKNLVFEAIKKILNRKQKLYIHVNREREIIDAINFSSKHQISMVLVGGEHAYKVADLLLKNNIPVIINRPHRVAGNNDTDYDFAYKLANKLVKKGILVAIGMDGQMERMNTRNLPFYAGTCAAYGLEKEEALKLITSNTAKILEIDSFVGTLEVGKDATLFISKGDALDMRTNQLTDAFIQGRKISLETHQTTLWKRYSNKYETQK